jgi:hypothetical protein
MPLLATAASLLARHDAHACSCAPAARCSRCTATTRHISGACTGAFAAERRHLLWLPQAEREPRQAGIDRRTSGLRSQQRHRLPILCHLQRRQARGVLLLVLHHAASIAGPLHRGLTPGCWALRLRPRLRLRRLQCRLL